MRQGAQSVALGGRHPRLIAARNWPEIRSVLLIGIISDTHGLVRPQAKAALRGCHHLVHAGDVGKACVLDELSELAPMTAIRGNVDVWAHDLPDTEAVSLGGKRFFVIHNLGELDFDPRAAGFDAVIHGHSHIPKAETRDRVLYLNPGSAGPRRFKLPISVARLRVSKSGIAAELIELQPT